MATTEPLESVGEPEAAVVAPYPGPRPFRTDEAPIFFGRERETSQLRSLVLGHSLVLLYSESGAGKSSMLNAGLIPALRERDVTVFPPLAIRSSGPTAPAPAAEGNVFVRAMAANWAMEVERSVPPVTRLRPLVRVLSRAYEAVPGEPCVLIVDQFEELFTQFQENWKQRAGFFTQIQHALDTHRGLRVLLSMREDYLAQTDPYAALLETRLQHRFRIERLREPAAREAIVKPLEGTTRRFAAGAAEYLADELLQVRLEREDGVLQAPGEFVEPVQLQIVCSSLWEGLETLPEDVIEITREHIDRFAQVDRALARFYRDVVERVASHTRTNPLSLRRWCEAKLITPGGTRALIYRGPQKTEGKPNRVVDLLEREHLIRGENRAGAHWYELSHDKFVGAIQTENRRAFEEHVGRRRKVILTGIAVAVLASVLAAILVGRATHSDQAPAAGAAAPQIRPELVRTLEHPALGRAGILSAAFAADGGSVVAVGADGVVRLLNVATDTMAVLRTTDLPAKSTSAALSRNGALVVTGHDDGTVRIWTRAGPSSLALLRQSKVSLSAVAFRPDARRVVTGDERGRVRIWDWRSDKETTLGRQPSPITSAAFSRDGSLAVTGDVKGHTRVWSLAANRPSVDLHSGLAQVFGVAFSPRGDGVITASGGNAAMIFAEPSRQPRRVLPHPAPVTSASFISDGAHALTAGTDGAARVWDVRPRPAAVVAVLRPPAPQPLIATVFEPQGNRVLTMDTAGTVRIWKLYAEPRRG